MAKAKKKTLKKTVSKTKKTVKAAPKKKAKPAKKAAPTKKAAKRAAAKPMPKAKLKAKPKANRGAAAPKTKASAAKTVKQPFSSGLLQPLDNRIVIAPVEAEKTTLSGLILPDAADDSGNLKGRVIAVGRGHQNKKGRIQPIELKVGDEVLYSRYAGSKISWNGQDLLVVRENEILGIVET